MNSFLTLQDITYECARILVNNTVAAKYVNRTYDDRFAKNGAKIGDVTNLRLPTRSTVSDGDDADIKDENEQSVPLRLDKRKHIAFAFSSVDRTLRMDDFSKRHLQPKVAALANQVDADVLAALGSRLWNSVGAPGTTPNASSVYLGAGVKLDNNSAPQDEDRFCIMPSQNHATLVAAEQTLFHDSKEISRQYRKGRIGVAHGFNFYMDQNAYTHVAGTYTVAGTVNGAGQTGNQLVTAGWTAANLKAGDVFSVAGVFGVNPMSYQSTGQLQQFRVTADVSDAAGAMTIPFEPEMVASGPFQTVTALPANGAQITMYAASGVSSPQAVAFHRDAACLAMVDLEPLGAGVKSYRLSDPQTGVSMMVSEGGDITKFRTIVRLDMLYGIAIYRGQLGCRIWS